MENVKLFLEKANEIMFGYSTDEEYDNRENRITKISDFYLDNITNKLLSMDKDTRCIYAIRILKTIDSKLSFCEIEDYEQQFYQKLGDILSDFGISLNELVGKMERTYPSFCKGINFTPYITGMAIPHIYFKDYGKAKLFYPSIEKRIRIASLLHNIEQKLVVEQNLVISLSAQKSYLLRMLFI